MSGWGVSAHSHWQRSLHPFHDPYSRSCTCTSQLHLPPQLHLHPQLHLQQLHLPPQLHLRLCEPAPWRSSRRDLRLARMLGARPPPCFRLARIWALHQI